MQHKRQMVMLGDVLSERTESPDASAIFEGRIAIVEKISFDTGKLSLRTETRTRTSMITIRPGDLVISGINAAKGAIALYDESNREPVAATIHYSAYSIKKEKAVALYLWYLLRSDLFRRILAISLPGGIKTELKPKRLLRISVPLPPITEQQRIVLKIEKLVEEIERIRKIKGEIAEDTNLFFQSILSQVFRAFRDNMRPLEELCYQITDGEHATPLRIEFSEIPLVTAKNVRDGHLDLTTTDFVSSNVAKKCWNRCKPQDNDVLLICVGATIGRVCRLVDPPQMVIVRSVALIRPNDAILDSRYLKYALESPECQTQIWNLVKKSAQPCLYINRIKRITIPTPKSVSEQTRIVSFLDLLKQKINEIDKLKIDTDQEISALTLSIISACLHNET